MNNIKKLIDILRSKDIYPDIRSVQGVATEPEIIVDGKRVILFCSNNYLGLSNNKEVKESIKNAVEKYGMGSGGSRLVSGNLDIHQELEHEIASFKGSESAVNFLSGYMANTGTIPAVLTDLEYSLKSIFKNKLLVDRAEVFSDELNHASIVDGCRLSKAEIVVYKHKDTIDLEKKLKKSKALKKLIISDGVFSMDGDIAPIDKLADLAEKYRSMLMIDDAHGSGVLGPNGEGTEAHFILKEVKNKVDITLGTYTKAFGGVGGFVSGTKALTDFLRITARSYIFSAPIPPSISAGLITAIKIAKNEGFRREKLISNAKYLRLKLKDSGFNVLGETPIIPVVIGKDEDSISMSRKLFEKGIFAPAIRWPAVPKNQSRLRLTVMATHTKEQIDTLVDSLNSL